MQGPLPPQTYPQRIIQRIDLKKKNFPACAHFLVRYFCTRMRLCLQTLNGASVQCMIFVRLLLTTNYYYNYISKVLCFALFLVFCFPCKQGLSEYFVISQLGRTLLNRIFGPGFLVHIILRKGKKNININRDEPKPEQRKAQFILHMESLVTYLLLGDLSESWIRFLF